MELNDTRQSLDAMASLMSRMGCMDAYALSEARTRQARLLTEAKLNVLRKYHPDIDDRTFQEIVQADPKWKTTKSDTAGGYTRWLLDLYEKDHSMVQRLRQISDDLREYNPNTQPDRAPIGQVKDDRELHDRVKSLYGNGKEISRQERFNNDIVFQNDEWTIVSPSTHSSARYWGQDTSWCTSSENEYFFEHYTKMGPLYILISKQTNDKWQLHGPTESAMDSDDEPFDIYDLNLSYDVLKFLIARKAIPMSVNLSLEMHGAVVKKHDYDADNQCYDFYVTARDTSWGDWYYLEICRGYPEIDQCSVYGNDVDDSLFYIIANAVEEYAEENGLIEYDDETDKYRIVPPDDTEI